MSTQDTLELKNPDMLLVQIGVARDVNGNSQCLIPRRGWLTQRLRQYLKAQPGTMTNADTPALESTG